MSHYSDARPWPHAVIDGFLPDDVAKAASMAFPDTDWPAWKTFAGKGRALKRECASYEAMPRAIQAAVDCVNLVRLLQVRATTGFDDLRRDPALYGGGLNLVAPGGFLAPHADFNYRDGLGYRTVNLLVYLNDDWREGDGGELELWDGDRIAKRIAPTFNRAVIFTTTGDAVHGYGPVNRMRRSMNFYFYRKTAAHGIAAEPHRTLWKEQAA